MPETSLEAAAPIAIDSERYVPGKPRPARIVPIADTLNDAEKIMIEAALPELSRNRFRSARRGCPVGRSPHDAGSTYRQPRDQQIRV